MKDFDKIDKTKLQEFENKVMRTSSHATALTTIQFDTVPACNAECDCTTNSI
jgi:hypothetical protein